MTEGERECPNIVTDVVKCCVAAAEKGGVAKTPATLARRGVRDPLHQKLRVHLSPQLVNLHTGQSSPWPSAKKHWLSYLVGLSCRVISRFSPGLSKPS